MRRISNLSFSLYILIFCLFPATEASGIQSEHGPQQNTEGLMRGERLFYGLIDGTFESKACADCHNTIEIDTFNWNPNALEIASKYKDKSLEDFRNAVLNPTGVTMGKMHSTFNLSDTDIEQIKMFLDDFAEHGLEKAKPVINKLFLFLLLGVVLTWVILDIFFIKKIRRRWILGIIFLAALAWQVKLLYNAGTSLGRQQNYEPDQPVKFSHVVHATDNRINCRYCHTTVEESRSAGIPAVGICWNCHTLVREGTHSGKHEINKVVDAYDSGEPIRWIRVHNLQDHVFFSHAQHVAAGKIECSTCHGDIGSMDRVRQVSDLSMGWCINCHRDTEVQFFDNEFYTQYKELQNRMKSGEIDRVTVEMIGGTECSKCHY
jgi:cytochrome c553